MAKSVMLNNGRQWRTQHDALEHFKQMLARYRNGERVADPSDHADLCALISRYDEFVPAGEDTKAGQGVSHFSRESNASAGWTTDGFHVHRLDSTSIDFSYIEAVKCASEPVSKT
ncbi:hypothetical protein R69658_07583 [Paraburkholderia aspalathi]|uniref:Uncharacterized protein n=1 Tax=Paraburkholderia aspalathi TaxID=1324617 RepID=A0ABM8T6E2_9BURK|nr:DUF3223 domain-containing protein [Paraburkholderia aspalathi]MBK3823892.1 DCL family protein [Paraburkholderia aspalathi]MBK3835737.1 DCL family protein [Paraburkholderia aspalathi]MBK3865507.1 DCL family protein [Paraburkholderia aspalathi]CAE6860299.1 hypothetical protein R69658_07583 [Paraburkholderia aspalathi]